MKKGILIVGILFFTLTAFTVDLSKSNVDEISDTCVLRAWDSTDKECGRKFGDGCTQYQQWTIMNKYYDACDKARQR